jgi:MFS family permease
LSDRVAERAGPTAGNRHGVVILATSVMPIMAIISLIPVLPLLMREFAGVSFSVFLVPIALTVPALCVALFSPLAGWLSDRLGRKKLLVTALVLYAAFGIVPWFLDDLFQIVAARIALGLVEAVIMTVSTALIGDYFEGERREKWIALQVAVGSIAAIALIAVSGGLAEAFGSRGPFLLYLLALPAALTAAIVLFEPPVTAARIASTGTTFPYRTVLPLVLTTLFVGIVFYTVNVQLGPILELSGPVSPGAIGLIGALLNLAIGAGTFVFHRLKQHAGPQLLMLGLIVAALGYAGMGLTGELAALSAFAVLACAGSGIMLPTMLAWTMKSLPPETRGRGIGIWTGAFFLGQFLAPLMATALTRVTGNLATSLLAYAVLIAGAATALLVLPRLAGKPAVVLHLD